MEDSAGRVEFQSLKARAAQLKEENERLEQQAKQLEKEIQQLKVQGAQMEARKITAEEVGPFHLYVRMFSEPMGPAALRSCADIIQREDPSSITFLADAQGYCVAATGGTAQKQGISAQKLMELSTQLAGGSGGGRESMAQGRIEKLDLFSAIGQRLEQYLKKERIR